MSTQRRFPISLWVIAFSLCSALQVFRGSIGDEIIFLTGTAILVLCTTALRKLQSPFDLGSSSRTLEIVAFSTWVIIALIPRHTTFEAIPVVAVAAAAIPVAWGKTAFDKKPLPTRDRKARLLWIIWAVLVCLWEFAANILGQLDHTHHNFPTISILVDPLLDSAIGKAGFALCWVAVGFGLIKQGARHK